MNERAVSQPSATGISFDHIVRAEVAIINRRRKGVSEIKPDDIIVKDTGANAPVLDVLALALSGGGIRSASFSLGVLQALNEKGVIPKIDYLSTVSGGGYMGSALSATMTKQNAFVFGESTRQRGSTTQLTDVKDTDSVGHIRNYSNYLMPFGARDLVTAIAIIVRGLVANVSLILPVILLLAAITIFGSPDRTDLLRPNLGGIPLTWLSVTHFGITLLLALTTFPIFFAWGLVRSLRSDDKQAEFRTWAPFLAAAYLILVAAVFFCELQPFLIAGMFDLADQANAAGEGNSSLLTAFVKNLAAITAPIAAVVTVFRQQIGTLLKSATTASGVTTRVMALGAQAALWIAGAAVPLLIWVGYLYLCYWGIINNTPPPAQTARTAPIHGTVELKGPGVDLRGTVDCRPSAENPCAPLAPRPASDPEAETKRRGAHTPSWLINAAGVTSETLQWVWHGRLPERLASRPVTLLYLSFGLLLFALSYLLQPNANSLHRLYRDRLSKAFLFDPGSAGSAAKTATIDRGRDFQQLEMRISDLVPKEKVADAAAQGKNGTEGTQAANGTERREQTAEREGTAGGAKASEAAEKNPPRAPYHLINAALNIQGSDYANRRGRNADFFLFSPCYVGSEATGYAPTKQVEDATGLDLPTAMAISGAAFSSNMGANSIRALTPTLALLNVRTGYWLTNPRAIAAARTPSIGARIKNRLTNFYLWSEITGRLYEDSEEVYITDGGHIENLGLYELLRRRCKVIVAVDAEADPAMRLPSFITLQRYARIDLGVRINMPWDRIRSTTIGWMGFGGSPAGATPASATPSPERCHGPHAAIGTIDYDGGETGWLLYIKSSLSGDENDYVRDYARRYNQFPHESTGDQFFSEEQFEVYRALGFHITSRLLNGDDKLEVYGASAPIDIKTADPNVDPVRKALLG
jgi:hypothetical protein